MNGLFEGIGRTGHRDMRGQDGEICSSNQDHISVWPWEDAPEAMKKFSEHGGDEDGVIWVPNKFLVNMEEDQCYGPLWLENLWRGYGPSQDFIRFTDGVLIIWAHA